MATVSPPYEIMEACPVNGDGEGGVVELVVLVDVLFVELLGRVLMPLKEAQS